MDLHHENISIAMLKSRVSFWTYRELRMRSCQILRQVIHTGGVSVVWVGGGGGGVLDRA